MSNQAMYWNSQGAITCKHHSPYEGSDTWNNERWREIKTSERLEIAKMGSPVACEVCKMERYQVQVHSANSCDAFGKPVIEADCGHKHRSLEAAQKCCDDLTRRLPDGSWLAEWYHADVYVLESTEHAGVK